MLYMGEPELLETKLKKQFFNRQLFMIGTYAVKVESRDILAVELQHTDLFSLWEYV